MRMTRPQDSEAATATSIAAGEAKLPPALLSLIFCTILKGRTSDAALDRWRSTLADSSRAYDQQTSKGYVEDTKISQFTGENILYTPNRNSVPECRHRATPRDTKVRRWAGQLTMFPPSRLRRTLSAPPRRRMPQRWRRARECGQFCLQSEGTPGACRARHFHTRRQSARQEVETCGRGICGARCHQTTTERSRSGAHEADPHATQFQESNAVQQSAITTRYKRA